ncbi:MAG: hypothetical protein WA882_00765 [Geitlerinemataceae cyanobacterium]
MPEPQDTQEELKPTQLQLRQLEGELEDLLEYFQDRSYRQQEEIFITRNQLQQTQTELTQTRQELGQIKSEFDRVEMELELAKFWQVLEAQTDDPREKRYRELVWRGWYVSQKGDRSAMVRYLQEAWKYSSVSLTQTVSDWLRCFVEFAENKGIPLDVQGLAGSVEWRGLMRELVVVKGIEQAA